MKVKGRVNGNATFISAVAIAGGVSFLVMLLLTAVLAWMIGKEHISENAAAYGTLVVQFISSAAGAVFVCVKQDTRRIQACLAAGLLYYVSLLCVTALFFEGQYTGLAVTAMCILAASVSVGLLTAGGKTKRSKSRYKVHSR